MEKNKKNIIMFTIMLCGYWCSWICFNMYLIFYLQSIGIDTYRIGTILTLGVVTGTIGQYTFGHLCDAKKTVKKILIFCLVVTNCIILGFGFFKGFTAIVLVYSAIMFFQSVVPTLIDSWIIEYNEVTRNNYSKMRSVSSPVFAICSIFFGTLVDSYGYVAMALGFTIFNGLLIMVCILSKDIKLTGKSNHQSVNKRAFLGNLKFLVLMLGIVLIFVSNSFITNFMSIIVQSAKGSAAQIGMVFSIAALSEVPVFFLFNRIRRKISLEKILFLASIFFFAKIFTLLFVKTPFELYLNALFQGLSYALFYGALRLYVSEIVPENMRITGQSIGSAYIVFSILALLGVFVFFILSKYKSLKFFMMKELS